MEAVVIEEFGGPEVFKISKLPDPIAGPGQVLIRVQASSVNPVDYKIRDGRVGFLVPALPAILHPDCAGRIEAVGDGVDEFSVGDEVFAFASGFAGKPGALADLMTADARMVAKKPSTLSFAEAAALPLVTVTAWYVLVDKARITEGTSVFIEGGTGGVGHIAIQLAKHLGAQVFASCGTDEKCRIAESLGAKKAFNYNTNSPEDMIAASPDGRGYDVVFNTPGGASIDRAVSIAAFGGVLYDILGDFPVRPGFQMKWLSFTSVFAGRSILQDVDQVGVGEILTEAAHLVDTGKLKPLLDPKRFSFNQVGEAHDYAENQSPIGKVVLTRR